MDRCGKERCQKVRVKAFDGLGCGRERTLFNVACRLDGTDVVKMEAFEERGEGMQGLLRGEM